MATDKRVGWLASLKVGDTVVVQHTHGPPRLTRVAAISASGQITVDGGPRFTPRGQEVGTGSSWTWTSLREANDRMLADVERAEAMNAIRNGNLTNERIKQIADLLAQVVEVSDG